MSFTSIDDLKRFVKKPVSHPLLLADIGDLEVLRDRMTRGRLKEIMQKIVKRADKLINNSIPQLPRSLYDDFFRTGRRYLFERPYFLRRRAVEDLTLAYIFTGKLPYLDRCRDYIWAIMEEFTWVIPAHSKLPFHPENIDIVDLFSSGTAMLLADTWDLLYNHLDKETLEWMRYNVFRRVLIPLVEHFEKQWWAKRYESNWCGVCCGNSGCALILMGLDEPWSMNLLANLLRSIDGFLSAADPEGAWVEGIGYWFYGFSRVIYFADLLAKVTEKNINLLEDPRIKATITFPVWTYLPPRSQVNFGDTLSTPSGYFKYIDTLNFFLSFDILNLFLTYYREPSIAWYIRCIKKEGLLNSVSIREILWEPSTDIEPMPPKDTSKWYHKIGVIITRTSWEDPDAPILAVKAGHNGEPHNHLDVGQFIYHCYGNSFICDLGVGIYDREYFGPRRYENPICGAEGHNLIFVDGRSQGIGPDYKGEIITFTRRENWELISLDITKAYPPEVLSKAIRNLIFFKYNGLLLIDEVACKENALVETRLHFKGSLNKAQRGLIDVSAERGSMQILLDDPSLEVIIAGHGMLQTWEETLINAKYIRLIKRANKGIVKIKAYIIPYKVREEIHSRLSEIKRYLPEIGELKDV